MADSATPANPKSQQHYYCTLTDVTAVRGCKRHLSPIRERLVNGIENGVTTPQHTTAQQYQVDYQTTSRGGREGAQTVSGKYGTLANKKSLKRTRGTIYVEASNGKEDVQDTRSQCQGPNTREYGRNCAKTIKTMML